MMAMDCDYSLLNVNINYHNFPAKLWRLTNNPQNSSVFWGPTGESLMVDQQQFEIDLLTPVKLDNKPFKTSNFTSFIRQLNLYGFKKILDGSPRDKHRRLHHFYNPNFRQGQPELLVHLKRLAISKKTKSGEKESYRPLNQGQQKTQRKPAEENRGSAQLSGGAVHQQRECERSPIPGHPWIFPCADASSFYSNPGLPLSVYPYATTGRAHSGAAFLFPQDIPHHLSYPAALYSPVCQCCTSMQADQAGGNQASLSYSHYAYYPNYSVSHQHSSFQPTNWPAHRASEQRGDMNLDRVFQMVDDFQGLSNVRIVQVGPSVKPHLTSSPPLYTIPAVPKAQSVSLQSIETVAFSPPRDRDECEDHSQSNADLESSELLKDAGLSFKVKNQKVMEENIRN